MRVAASSPAWLTRSCGLGQHWDGTRRCYSCPRTGRRTADERKSRCCLVRGLSFFCFWPGCCCELLLCVDCHRGLAQHVRVMARVVAGRRSCRCRAAMLCVCASLYLSVRVRRPIRLCPVVAGGMISNVWRPSSSGEAKCGSEHRTRVLAAGQSRKARTVAGLTCFADGRATRADAL